MLVVDSVVANEGDKIVAFSTDASECGIYKLTSGTWEKQYPPTTEMISEAWPDIIWAVNNGYPASGTASEKIQAYTGSGVTYFEMLAANRAFIDSLASSEIHVLTSGAIYGGDRFDKDGNVVSSGVDGWWFGAGENVGFKARGKVLDFTFCKPDGTVVGQINADNILFDTEDYNTSLGYYGIPESATGDYNVAFGYSCLKSLTTGEKNVAIGYKCGDVLTTGNRNIIIGSNALLQNDDSDDTIAIGSDALRGLSSGSNYQNIAIGTGSMIYASDGFYGCNNNIAIGGQSLRWAKGGLNIAIGYSAFEGYDESGSGNSGLEGVYNIGIGFYVARAYLEAYGCTDIGNSAVNRCTYGWYHTNIGENVAQERPGMMPWCIAIGWSAFKGNNDPGDSGEGTIAIGSLTLNNGGNPKRSIAIGHNAAQMSTGEDNVIVGAHSSKGMVTGNQNVAIGAYSMASAGNVFENVAIGYNALYGITGSGNTAIGHGAGDLATSETNITCIGKNAQITGSNQIQLGDSSTTVYAYGPVQDRSDKRDKADIRDTVLGLDFIKELRPVDFRWDLRDDYVEIVETEYEEIVPTPYGKPQTQKVKIISSKEKPKDGSKKRTRFHHGLIAQEVKTTMDKLGVDFGGYQDHKIKGGKDVLTIGYEELIGPMIKAIQEQNEIIKKLEARIVVLESKNLTAN
ncbi:MAG TPA: hypothetical protein DCS12_07090 [Clostridiales bacterium]|nr:hypothetical protein [Clostridiales bacterium]